TNPPTPEVPGFAGTIDLSKYMQACALQKSYFRLAVRQLGGNPNNPATFAVLNSRTDQNEGAECLYLILSTIRDRDKQALDYFDGIEIGDTDEDGMKEILDGWGTPIEFLRWAPGYLNTPQTPVVTTQAANTVFVPELSPDPFDPARVDPRWSDGNPANNP